jgi:hypothetical protein
LIVLLILALVSARSFKKENSGLTHQHKARTNHLSRQGPDEAPPSGGP